MISANLQRSWMASWYSVPSRLSGAASTCAQMAAIPARWRLASLKNMATFPTSKDAGRKPKRNGSIRRSEPGGGLWKSRIAGSIAFASCRAV